MPEAKPIRPPVIDLRLELTDMEGVTNSCTLPIRILNRDETLDVHRLAAFYSGIDFDLLGAEARDMCLARATIEVMWKNNEVPEWLKTAMVDDEAVSLKLYTAVNSHRIAYFRGDYREGKEGKKPPGLVISPILPANVSTK